AAALPEGVAKHPSLGIDQALVRVGELRAPQGPTESFQLLRVPAVVLIGHRDQLRLRGNHSQRSLEIPVEPEPRIRTREQEALVWSQHLLDLLEPLGARAVVADQAHPSTIGL